MGLRNIPLPTEQVKVSDEHSFAVRGLSPDDILRLFYRHRGKLTELFDQYAGRAMAEDVTVDDARTVGQVIFDGAPALAAEIILAAADQDPNDPEFEAELEHTRKFTAAVQLDALEKIARLSFTSDMPPEKLLAVVLKAAASTAAKALPHQGA